MCRALAHDPVSERPSSIGAEPRALCRPSPRKSRRTSRARVVGTDSVGGVPDPVCTGFSGTPESHRTRNTRQMLGPVGTGNGWHPGRPAPGTPPPCWAQLAPAMAGTGDARRPQRRAPARLAQGAPGLRAGTLRFGHPGTGNAQHGERPARGTPSTGNAEHGERRARGTPSTGNAEHGERRARGTPRTGNAGTGSTGEAGHPRHRAPRGCGEPILGGQWEGRGSTPRCRGRRVPGARDDLARCGRPRARVHPAVAGVVLPPAMALHRLSRSWRRATEENWFCGLSRIRPSMRGEDRFASARPHILDLRRGAFGLCCGEHL